MDGLISSGMVGICDAYNNGYCELFDRECDGCSQNNLEIMQEFLDNNFGDQL